jgi:predicted dehydrogenase
MNLGWAVVGVGDITRKRVFAALRDEPRSRLRAAVTTHPERARAVCDSYGVERIYTTLEEALADAEVQAVYVATPVFLHRPQTLAALSAGRHVLCEKPTALNPGEVDAMIAEARRCRRVLGVAFYRRMYRKVRRALELLRAGAIGRPTLVWACAHAWFDDELLRDRHWFLEEDKSGGGPLMDIGCHRIDLLNFMFGIPQVRTAVIQNQVHSFSVEDSATVTLEYPGAVRVVLDVRWNSKVSRDEFRIIGTEGELDLTPLNGPELRCKDALESAPPHPNLHYPMIENFVSAVVEGAPLVSSAETAIETDRALAAAYAAGGRR